MVCCLICVMWACSCWILALASASLAWSSEFSAERASRACEGVREWSEGVSEREGVWE